MSSNLAGCATRYASSQLTQSTPCSNRRSQRLAVGLNRLGYPRLWVGGGPRCAVTMKTAGNGRGYRGGAAVILEPDQKSVGPVIQLVTPLRQSSWASACRHLEKIRRSFRPWPFRARRSTLRMLEKNTCMIKTGMRTLFEAFQVPKASRGDARAVVGCAPTCDMSINQKGRISWAGQFP